MRRFSEEEIIDTYYSHVVKHPSYFDKVNQRYPLLSQKDKAKWFPKDFPRLAALFDFQDWVARYGLTRVDQLLATCKSDPELEYVKAKQLLVCDYSQDKKYDLHTLDLESKNFDFVIFNQTLEHLYNPFFAMEALYQHLKQGGFLYTTVPTINIPHMLPFHFWGITPIGLCMLAKSVGFEVVECGYWGNRAYIQYIFDQARWPTTADVTDEKGEIANDSSLTCQAQTWVLLQK